MHDKPTHKPVHTLTAKIIPPVNPLKLLSPEQFAALGVHSVVVAREIEAENLASFLPQAQISADAGPLLLLMSADGTPIMVTDSSEALDEWLEERPVQLATVH